MLELTSDVSFAHSKKLPYRFTDYPICLSNCSFLGFEWNHWNV